MYYTERLVQLREKNELTQEQVADGIGVQREQYRRYEAGENEIKAHHVVAFAKFYKVSADYILGLTDSPDKSWK